MKTIDQIAKDYKKQTIDGRDFARLIDFMSEEHLTVMGMELKEEFKEKHIAKEMTREVVLKRLEADVAFAFEKALNKRGISSSSMFSVVSMWNWVLEEGLENWSDDNYAMYGLPLFKATAMKYGWNNPIGDETGSEDHYSE